MALLSSVGQVASASMEIGRSQQLTGWGQTSPTRAQVYDLHVSDLPKLISRAGHRGVISRGLGRSYGDPAQNAGGSVVRLVPGFEPAELDESTGIVSCHAGVSIDDLLAFLVPRGRFVPVTPGTRFVTVGGAIASDVHGKNHHVDGSWGHALLSMRLLMADGDIRDVTAESDPGLWWATIGGMGLTGIIVEATFGSIAITSSRCVVDTDRATNLDEMMSLMESGDARYRYSVAWIDLLATGCLARSRRADQRRSRHG